MDSLVTCLWYDGAPPGSEGKVLTVEFTMLGRNFLGLDGGEPSYCGWLKDRWGMSWQITPTRLMELMKDPDPARAGRAMQAMMTMGKIDIAAIEAAAG